MRPLRFVSVLACLFIGPSTCVTAQADAPSFDDVVAPLLARRCLACHEGEQAKGKLDLSTRKGALAGGKNGDALVPGKPDESLMWEHVSAGHMPPKKPLPEAERQVLRRWIAAGAKWGSDPIDPLRYTTDGRAGYDWWSLQPVKRPEVPAADAAWCVNPIDHFVARGLAGRGLKPSRLADARTLIRRVTFDLTGLPPTPEEVDAFVRGYPANPQAEYARLVERLLASPHYGERWARHWLDVVRFGESNGFEHDEFRKNAWPYRDWVIAALNADVPYDRFVRLQLAGDVLAPDDPAAVAATGFLVAGAYDTVGQVQQSAVMKAVVRQDELEDVVGTIGQTLLGLTVQCARCHDHKFDPVRQSEYFRLTAAVAGVRHGERDISSPELRQMNAAAAERNRRRLDEITSELRALERPAREKILAERRAGGVASAGPESTARWDFRESLHDQVGTLHAKLMGGAKRDETGLRLNGHDAYASTPPLGKLVKAHTLSAWVKLDNLDQRGGATISLQTPDGGQFNAVVFGEREPRHWMAGSDFFRRTRLFGGQPESEAVTRPVHVAISFAEDGTVVGYRDGKPYGKPYKAPEAAAFDVKSQIVFGLRHSPPTPSRLLKGTLVRAELFDRALTAEEVAATSGNLPDYVPEKELIARLTEPARAKRQALLGERKSLKAEQEKPQPKTLVYAVTPRTPEPTYLLARGEVARRGELLTPGAIAALKGTAADFGLAADATDGERRVKLAEYITSPHNPLFARVIVNRLWHHHFGVGIVDTPSDFGFGGGRPSHPELLDWLADELVRRGWSLKELHRLVVTSATYRQQSRFDAAAAKVDAGNRLLWRKSPARLDAESVRDAMLHVAGQLDPAVGGPGYHDFKITVRGASHFYEPVEVDGPARRSVYRAWARSGRNGLLDTLDCPDPSTVTPKRAVTTTPLQALSLLNNPFVLRQAGHFAGRVRREAGDDASRQVERAYRLAFARTPAAEEGEAARRVVEQHGLAVLCRAIFNSSEFLYVD